MNKVETNSDKWLADNNSLRMDANCDLFPEDRRKFHLRRYQFAMDYCHGKRVLDGACGTGYGSALIAGVAREVVGIDISSDAIQYATEKYASMNTRFKKSCVEYTDFEAKTFDVVISFETVEHTLCPKSHMREIVRLLDAENGLAILSVPNSWGLTDHHFFDFDFDLFRSVLKPHFEQIDFFYQLAGVEMDSDNYGIGPVESALPSSAQCILAVCAKPRQDSLQSDPLSGVFDEIYSNAFTRHNEYRTLAYKVNTNFFKRCQYKIMSEWNKLKSLSFFKFS
ncbi:bifunctional 2-polyprenyl-6-hydroxyphenol methylase/3-demethylubiquinol 3-O-methyltransferase UbiG [Sedimenticola selenatireducens]|uniref:class I SAM-dependent methyltransferase n=1 Tax=Sedimenticola selenatireducens TaxID=191960 RepID=UPI0009FF63DA|nr:class I SAM-dependent methyltransferase [Sedimenticola selenatireducens]